MALIFVLINIIKHYFHLKYIYKKAMALFLFRPDAVPPDGEPPTHVYFSSTCVGLGLKGRDLFHSYIPLNILFSLIKCISEESRHIRSHGTLSWNPKIKHQMSKNSIFLPCKQRSCIGAFANGGSVDMVLLYLLTNGTLDWAKRLYIRLSGRCTPIYGEPPHYPMSG